MTLPSTTTPLFARFSNLRQRVCIAASIAAFSLAAVPSTALAVGADGSYRITGIKGQITAGGETQKIPKSALGDITRGQASAVVIKNQKIKFNRNTTAILLKQIAKDAGLKVNPKVTGPTSLTLVVAGQGFSGKTKQPIITKITGSEDGEKFLVTGKTYVTAVVKGDSLTLTTRFAATDGEDELTGTITIDAKR